MDGLHISKEKVSLYQRGRRIWHGTHERFQQVLQAAGLRPRKRKPKKVTQMSREEAREALRRRGAKMSQRKVVNPGSRVELQDLAVREYMTKHEVDYPEAFEAVRQAKPNLFKRKVG